MAKDEKETLQWHPAFYAGIQIEFEDEADKLIFENEHQLGTKPKEIDVLILMTFIKFMVMLVFTNQILLL